MQPTDIYIKSKRNLLIFSAILFIVLLSDIELSSGEISEAGIKLVLKDASLINIIICIFVLYSIVQTSLFWSAQNEEIKTLPQFKVDYSLSMVIGLGSVGSYAYFSTDAAIEGNSHYFISIVMDKLDQIKGLISFIVGVISSLVAALLMLGSHKVVEKFRIRRAKSEEILISSLTTGCWTLDFNPKSSQGKKNITFLPTGEIGDGRNDNEHAWRTRGNFLEIVNNNGEVFSRFKSEDNGATFHHTNDDDTKSIRNQRIFRQTNDCK